MWCQVCSNVLWMFFNATLFIYLYFVVLVVCTMFDFCLYPDIRARRRQRLKKKGLSFVVVELPV